MEEGAWSAELKFLTTIRAMLARSLHGLAAFFAGSLSSKLADGPSRTSHHSLRESTSIGPQPEVGGLGGAEEQKIFNHEAHEMAEDKLGAPGKPGAALLNIRVHLIRSFPLPHPSGQPPVALPLPRSGVRLRNPWLKF